MSDPVARARALLAAATPGPFEIERVHEGYADGAWDVLGPIVRGDGKSSRAVLCQAGVEADAVLIAASPELLAELADEVERMRAADMRLRTRIGQLGLLLRGEWLCDCGEIVSPTRMPADRGLNRCQTCGRRP